MEVLHYLEEFNTVSIIIRLLLATLFGGIIGMEREMRRHSAGFRTFTLVSLSAALLTIANLYLLKYIGSTDVARIPAALINGIGFLGAGTIIVTRKNQVRGLTTAAGLVATASLGIALGAGMLVISSVAFVLIMVTITILRRLSLHIAHHNRMIELYVEFDTEDGIDEMIRFVRERGYHIVSYEKSKEKATILEIDLIKKKYHSEVLSDITNNVKSIRYLEEE